MLPKFPTKFSGPGDRGDSAVIDFRQLSDRPVSQLRATQGEYAGMLGSDTNFRVRDGKLENFTGVTNDTIYIEVRCKGAVRHAWMVLEFGALADIAEGGGCLLGIANNPGWVPTASAGMSVHDAPVAKLSGVAKGQWGATTYPSRLLNASWQMPWALPLTAGITFPGRTVKFEIVFWPETGRTMHFVDGQAVHTAIEAGRIGAAANQVLIQTPSPGVKVLEFGGSTRIPEELFQDHPQGVISKIPVNTHCNDAWQALYTFPIWYPPSGMVEIYASPWFGNVGPLQGLLMNVGAAAGSAPDSNLANPFRMINMGTTGSWTGCVNFRELRGGQPGTMENVTIFMKGSTGIYHEDHNEGPGVRAVGSMIVHS